MKALNLIAALAVMAVLVAAGAGAGENRPFHEDELYESRESMAGRLEQTVISVPLFRDRYENFLYDTDTVMAHRSAEAKHRFLGIQPGWDGLE